MLRPLDLMPQSSPLPLQGDLPWAGGTLVLPASQPVRLLLFDL